MKKILISSKKGNDLYMITFYDKKTQDKLLKNLSKLKKFINIKEVSNVWYSFWINHWIY